MSLSVFNNDNDNTAAAFFSFSSLAAATADSLSILFKDSVLEVLL